MVNSGLLRQKAVHIKLDKETHANFRTRLFAFDLSMQQAFEEFARLLGAGDSKATRIAEQLAMKLVRKRLEDTPSSALYPARPKQLDEQDHDALYSLINDDDEDDGHGGSHGNRAA